MPAKAITALLVALVMMPVATAAQEDDVSTTVFADDRYIAGGDYEIDDETTGDLFAAGEEITLSAPVSGAAHMAGRRLSVEAPVAGALYAAGYEISLDGAFDGPLSVFGAEVEIDGSLARNLRAFASDLSLSGDIAGSVILAADELDLDAAIAGDVMMTVREVDFREGARVDGQVILYVEDGDAPAIPESVAPPDRVEIRDLEAWDSDVGPSMRDLRRAAWLAAIRGFAFSVLLVAAIAAVAIFFVPGRVVRWRERALAEPGRSLAWGFGALSLIWGAGVVLAFTVFGLPLLPAAFLIGAALAYGGYVLGSYVLGVAIWLRLGNVMPDSALPKIGLAALGAVVAGLLALIPFLGWLFVMALALFGLGALVNSYRARKTGGGDGEDGAGPVPVG
ncbi:hypothetical protein KUV65_07445 [Maritalea mobilis]|uniref:hypothetical protein n=1 Tax=Maritalea mobilis TaxID=483324 RepID=UPI001C97427B|nr:hypothetical protein [Maritalea mobilis]MBY6201188.1 hypothetical protein [Maritalea mobilis]